MTTCVDTLGRPAPCQAPLSYTDRLDLASRAGFTGADLYTIVAISQAESQGIPNNKEPGGSGYGVVQIDRRYHPNVSIMQALDPQFSFNFAKHLVDSIGFSRAFATYSTTDPQRSYRQFLRPTMQAEANRLASGGMSLPGQDAVNSLQDSLGGTVSNAVNSVTGIPNAIAGIPGQLQTVAGNAGKSILPYVVLVGSLLVVGVFLLKSFIR